MIRRKYQAGGPPPEGGPKEVRQFFTDYLNSPNYKKRLALQGYDKPERVINNRKNFVNEAKVIEGYDEGSNYDLLEKRVYVNPNDAYQYNTGVDNIMAHELSHPGGSLVRLPNFNPMDLGLNNNETRAVNYRNNLSSYRGPDRYKLHDAKANELKADIDSLRYQLKRDNIYDTGTQDFNVDFLKKTKEKYKNDKLVQRVFGRVNDEDLIWIMNNIAQNSPDESPEAQMGGDMKSMLGYSAGSPYQNDPFIDIFTPGGLIDMSNTPKDLIGIDNKGNKKKMKAYSKNPYKFEGDMVREIPSNPYMQQGGIQDLYSYLFDDEEDNQPTQTNAPTAPDSNELEAQQRALDYKQKQLEEQDQYNQALDIANQEFSPYNPYKRRERPKSQDDEEDIPATVNPFVLQTQKDFMSQFNLGNLGIWGDKAHQQRQSDHNTGDAQDFSFDTPQTASDAVGKLMQQAKERKVKYIIYNGKIWNPSISNDWRPYEGKDPHTKHFHVSYNR